MSNQQKRDALRRFLRPIAIGSFSGLLALAISIAIVSFLTACKCMEPFVPKSK